MLVEDAVRQLKYAENSILDDPAFIKVYNTAGQKEMANIYLQGNHLPDILSPLLSTGYKNHIPCFSTWATWTELDLNLRGLNLKLNGFSSLNDSLPEFVSVLGSQKAIELSVEKVLPSSTSMYLSQSLTDQEAFKKKLENWMKNTGCFSEVEELKKQYNNKLDKDIGELFLGLIDNEFALAVTQINGLNVFQNGYLILKTKSKSTAEDLVKEALNTYATKNGEVVANYISQIQIDAGAKYTLYNLPWEKLGYILFGPLYSGVQCNCLVFFDNYIIIGSSKESLNTYIHSLLLNKTLATDIDHNSFKSEFSEKSNMFFYFCFINWNNKNNILFF